MNRRRIQSVLTNARRFEPETLYYVASTGTSLSLSDLLTLNEQIKLIKYNGGSVTLSGLTAKFSNATGYQFVTNPSSDLRKWIGYYITFTSSAGNTLKVKVSAAGTGETYTDLVTGDNSTFASDTGWWSKGVGWSIGSGVATHLGTTGDLLHNNLGLSLALYEYSVDLVITVAVLRIYCGGSYISHGASGTFSKYLTAGTTTTMWGARGTEGSNLTIDNLLIKQVLAPSATGIYFTDPQVVGTFNYYAASFTAVVTGQ